MPVPPAGATRTVQRRSALMTLWHGRLSGGTADVVMDYSVSLHFDRLLAHDDLAGSRAHVRGLGRGDLLTPDEVATLLAALDQVEGELDSDTFVFSPDDEDIHTARARIEFPAGSETARLLRRVHLARAFVFRGPFAPQPRAGELALVRLPRARCAGDRRSVRAVEERICKTCRGSLAHPGDSGCGRDCRRDLCAGILRHCPDGAARSDRAHDGRRIRHRGAGGCGLATARHATALVTTNYVMTGWLSFYLHRQLPMIQMNEDFRWLSSPRAGLSDLNGRLLYVTQEPAREIPFLGRRFAGIEKIAQFERMRGKVAVDPVYIYVLSGYRGAPVGRMP